MHTVSIRHDAIVLPVFFSTRMPCFNRLHRDCEGFTRVQGSQECPNSNSKGIKTHVNFLGVGSCHLQLVYVVLLVSYLQYFPTDFDEKQEEKPEYPPRGPNVHRCLDGVEF